MYEYIKEKLGKEIEEGKFLVEESSDAQFDLLDERFPMGLNRIDWDRIGNKEHINVGRPEGTSEVLSDEVEKRLNLYRETVKGWLFSNSISELQEVFWVGDSTDESLKMSVGTLIEKFPVLFSFPQHSYVIPSDGKWCLNYTMEDELFFGFSK